MKGSLIIVGFFVAGIICGLTGLLSINDFDIDVSFYALCALMFFVGISVGSDIDTLKGLRGLDMRLLFLPLFTIAGTLIACFLLSMLLPQRSPSDCMAVGAGFGYYSLSSIFITEYRGPLAPTSAGGATTMDTTLPIITQTSGKAFVILSIYHGFVVDFSVPLLVTLFCSV